MYRIVHEQPPPLRELSPAVPRELDEVIAKATAKVASERFSTASQMEVEMKRAAGSPAGAPAPVTAPIPVPQVAAPAERPAFCGECGYPLLPPFTFCGECGTRSFVPGARAAGPPVASPPIASPPIASPPAVSPPVVSPPAVSPPVVANFCSECGFRLQVGNRLCPRCGFSN
jgi:hypothetical protein